MVERSKAGPESGSSELDSKLVAALDRAGQALAAELRRRSREAGVTPTQARVLLRIIADGRRAQRVGTLAPDLDLSQPTISDAVATLVRKGLLERHPDPDDGRALALELTGSGERVAARLESWDQRIRTAVSELDPAGKGPAIDLLFDLLAGMNAKGVIAEARMCTTCRFFNRPEVGRPHCDLLDITLEPDLLRLDCPEHQAQPAEDGHPAA